MQGSSSLHLAAVFSVSPIDVEVRKAGLTCIYSCHADDELGKGIVCCKKGE